MAEHDAARTCTYCQQPIHWEHPSVERVDGPMHAATTPACVTAQFARAEVLAEAAAMVRTFTFMVEDASEVSFEQAQRITDAFIAEREEFAAQLDRLASSGGAPQKSI